MSYLAALLSLLLPIIVIQLKFVYRRRKLMASTWQGVLDRVQPVDIEGVRSIAECYLQPDKDQLRLEPNDMWEIVGGLEGIARLRSNAAAMLDLAMYAERWNQGDGPVVSEMIRRDAVRLNKAVTQIQLNFLFQFGFIRAPFHLQEAACSYYLIRSRLLGLYQTTHVALVPRLTAAL